MRRGKIQVTDASKFAEPIAELNRALAAPEFLGLLSSVFEIPSLLPDEELVGGGIHQTGPRGHLDVHVDFNYIEERQLHRRLNILIYFNKDWDPEWGGNIELWDKDVKVCHHSFSPIFNRCVVFATSEHQLSRRHGGAVPGGPDPKVVRRLLLHEGGAAPLGRRGALDDLQGPPRRGPQGQRPDAPGASRAAAPQRRRGLQAEDQGLIPSADAPPPRLGRPAARVPAAGGLRLQTW